MGFGTYGLPWIFLGIDPLAHLAALFPIEHLFNVAGYLAWALLVLAAWSAYLLIREVCGQVFPAFVGGALYAVSIASILRISQVDSTFAVLILIPLGMLVIRRLRPGNVAWCFVALVLVVTVLLAFTFLQEASYALLLLGAYALYRSVKLRNWYSLLVAATALCVSLVLTAPRLVTILQDLPLLDRTSTFFTTKWSELFRWFNDGVFGRFPGEARAINNWLNLHEGLQLYASTLATFLILAGALRVGSRIGAGAVAGFVIMLSWALSPWIGVEGAAALVSGVILAHAILRLRGGLARAADSRGYEDGDASFHLLVVVFVLGFVLIEPMRYVLYLAFARADLTHSRLSIIALLPESVLVSVFLRDGFGPAAQRVTNRSKGVLIVAAGILAAAASRLIDWLAAGPLTSRLGLRSPLNWDVGYLMLPAEVMKVVWSAVAFSLLCGALWATRRNWRARYGLACCLGSLMVAQGFAYADFQLSGPQTWTFPVPFENNDFLNVKPGILRPPTDQAVQALRRRLEADRYRTALVAEPKEFPAFVDPHLSQYWGLRVIGGYAPGVPGRLSRLPWPQGVRSLRALSFPDVEHLPWPLLAVLNVKYAVIVNPSLYFNIHDTGPKVLPGAPLTEVRVLTNPMPVTPREFFAADVLPTNHTRSVERTTVELRAPTGVNIRVVSSDTLMLSWVNVTPGAVYQVEHRRGTSGAYQLHGVTGTDATSHLAVGLKPGTLYSMRVRACKEGRCSPYSAEVSAVTAIPSLTAPVGVDAVAISADRIRVTWKGTTPGTEYRIERRESPGGTYVVAGVTSPDNHGFVVGGLAGLITYHLRVQACGPAGCSPHSAVVSAITPSALTATELKGVVPGDPTRISTVEGFPRFTRFATEGTIRARYDADTIEIRVDPSPHPRFLVINELYHPGWRASAGGRELRIYPTNVVMRGLVVPPGVAEIRLAFTPFSLTPAAAWLFAGGLVLVSGLWLVFRRVDTLTESGRSGGRDAHEVGRQERRTDR